MSPAPHPCYSRIHLAFLVPPCFLFVFDLFLRCFATQGLGFDLGYALCALKKIARKGFSMFFVVFNLFCDASRRRV